jgi:hypothetical protein
VLKLKFLWAFDLHSMLCTLSWIIMMQIHLSFRMKSRTDRKLCDFFVYYEWDVKLGLNSYLKSLFKTVWSFYSNLFYYKLCFTKITKLKHLFKFIFHRRFHFKILKKALFDKLPLVKADEHNGSWLRKFLYKRGGRNVKNQNIKRSDCWKYF